MRVPEPDRREVTADAAVRAGIDRHPAWLAGEREGAERRLDAAVRASPAWRSRDERLRGTPGIGPGASRALLAAPPELRTIDGGRAAARAGLAPFARDSGPRRGPRAIRGGRPDVRRVLDLAAPSAARCAGPRKAFAARPPGRGKRAKVALIAVARKPRTTANAVLRAQNPWAPELVAAR